MFKTIKRTLATLAIGVAVGGITLGGVHAEAAPQPPKVIRVVVTKPIIVEVPTSRLPKKACGYEDDNDCFWDAGKRGNGKGYSFWVDKQGRVIYLDAKLRDKEKQLAWDNAQRKAGKENWHTVDGHRDCWAKIGDTSYVQCWDGYKTTS
jgi:hypothetical protein